MRSWARLLVKVDRKEVMPPTNTVIQLLSTLELNGSSGIICPIVCEHTARDIACDRGQIARFIEILAKQRRARLAMGWIRLPPNLVFGDVAVDADHIDMIDQT